MLCRMKIHLPTVVSHADYIKNVLDFPYKGIGFPPIDDEIWDVRARGKKLILRRPTVHQLQTQKIHVMVVAGNTWPEQVHLVSDPDGIMLKGRRIVRDNIPAEIVLLPPGAKVRKFSEDVPVGWHVIRAYKHFGSVKIICTDAERTVTPYFKKLKRG